MPITGLQLITVTGTYLNLDGTPAAGTVTFTPSTVIVNTQADEIVYPTNFTVTLDSTGSFSIILPATNDPDLSPTGWVYTVTEKIIGSTITGRIFLIAIPYNAAGNTVDMADLTPAVSGPEYAGYALIGHTHTGSEGATEIVNHGSNANYARPITSTPVMWVGSVEPVNMLVNDLWLDEATNAVLLSPATLLIPPFSIVNSSGDVAWFTANAALFQKFDVPVGGTYRYVNHRIGTSSGNIQVGVVSLSGAGLLNYTRIAHSGVIASPGTGARRTDLGQFSLAAGPHAVFFWADNTTITTPTATMTSAGAMRSSTYPTIVGGVPASGTLVDWLGVRGMSGLTVEADI